MTIETHDDVVALKRIGRIVSFVLQEMLDAAEPGMTTRELDLLGERLLQEHGARSAPRLTYNFPGSTCISINEQAAHGIPGDRVIRAGDVLNVDVSAELGGYFADTGGTTVVPPTTPQKTRLCHATRTALAEAMKSARAGRPIHGMVISIEPFLSTRSRIVTETSDGWTLAGASGNLSAQYEHTMIITKGAPIVVTQH